MGKRLKTVNNQKQYQSVRSRAGTVTLTPEPAINRLALCIRAACLPTGLILGLATPVLAGPEGGQVVGGQGTINRPDTSTTNVNQQSQNMAIDWDSYNVNKNETVNYRQPNQNAHALNRIHDRNPSQILGTINANGRVTLLNSSGIYFGPSARVNVNSLIASGHDMSVEDFMNGRYEFKTLPGQSAGAVVNHGVLEAATGGSISLLGSSVKNEGLIMATAGQVNLVAGDQITMDFDGDGLMRFSVDKEVLANAEDLDSAITNTGEIKADGGQVLLSGRAAQDVFKHVVNNEGVIKAGRIENRGGKIVLAGSGGSQSSVVNTGRLDASAADATSDGGHVAITADTIDQQGTIKADSTGGDGGTIELIAEDTNIVSGNAEMTATAAPSSSQEEEQDGGVGGSVHVLGDKVALLDASMIDVSGELGGGEVLIGGDFQGKNPEIKNASKTYVGDNASIQADAKTDGNGGRVIVWADEWTKFYGDISARGGSDGGDGGFAEVSGKETLQFKGYADLSAPAGQRGTLLLDPTDIFIADGSGGTASSDTAVGDGTLLFADDPEGTGTSTISETTLEGLDTNIILQATNDITLNNLSDGNLNLANIDSESLVMQAGDNITFADTTDTITTAGGAIHLEADTPHSGTAEAADGIGTLTLGNLDSNGGNITLIGSDFAISSSITADAGNISIAPAVDGTGITLGSGVLSDAEFDLLSSTGIATIGFAVTAGSDGAGTGALNRTAGSLTIDQAITVGSATAGEFRLRALDGITLNESLTTNQTTDLNADTDANDNAGTLTVSDSFALDTTGNSLSITTNDLSLGATPTGILNSGAAATTITDSDGTGIGLGGTAVTDGLNISATELQQITATGLTLTTAGNITVDNITATDSDNIAGTTTLDAAGSVSFANNASTFNALSVLADDRVGVNVNVTTDMGGLALDGDADNAANTNDDIQFAAGVTLASAGALTLDATTGGMTGAGALTLNASNGIAINDSLTVGGVLNINANTTTDGNGLLNLVNGNLSTAAGNHDITIRAEDLDIAAGAMIDSGAGTIRIVENEEDGLALGAATTTGGMDISNDELGRIFTTGTLFLDQDNPNGAITVDGVTNSSAATVLMRTNALPAQIEFIGAASSFESLNVESGFSVTVNTDLTTTTGDLTLVADHNNDGGGHVDHVTLADGVTLTSAGNITLDVDPGQNGSDIHASGDLVLNAGGDINFLQDMEWTGAASTAISMTAGGTLFVEGTQTLNTTGAGQNLVIEAADVDLSGAINTGGTTVSITAASDGDITVGNAIAGELNLSDAELSRITAADLGVITTNTGAITIEGTTAGNTTGITTLTLNGASGVTVGAAGTSLTNSIDITGNTTLGGDLTTSGGNVVFNSSILVDGTRTVDSGNGQVAATAGLIQLLADVGSVDTASDTLRLDARGGTTDGAVDVQGNVGSGTVHGAAANDLTGFTVFGAQVDLATVETTSGNIAVTGSNIDLNSTSYQTSTSGAITFTGPVDLDSTGLLTVQTAGGAGDDITFDGAGTVDDPSNDSDLTLNAGADGDVSITGAAGATNALSSFTVSNAAIANLNSIEAGLGGIDVTGTAINLQGSDYITAAGEVIFNGAVVLETNVAVDTGGGGGNITFNSTLNATSAFTETLDLTAGTGNITFNGITGGTTELGAVTINSAGAINVNADFSLASLAANAGGGAPTIASFDASGTTISTSRDANDADSGDVLVATTGNLTAGTVTTAGTVSAAGGNISLYSTGGNLSLGTINTSGANGDAALLGLVSDAGENAGTLGLIADIGSITLNGNLAATGGDADGTSASGGNGGAVTIDGAVTLNTNMQIDTIGGTPVGLGTQGTDGNVTLTGSVASAPAFDFGLTVNARKNTNSTSTVDIDGATLTDLEHIRILAGSGGVLLGDITTGDGSANPVNANTSIDITSEGDITLAGDLATTGETNAGAISFNGTGNLVLADADGTVEINTDAGGTDANITFGMDVVSDTAATEGLLLTADSADITFNNVVGVDTATRVGDIDIVSANNVNINADIFATAFRQQNGTATTTLANGVTLDTSGTLGVFGISVETNTLDLGDNSSLVSNDQNIGLFVDNLITSTGAVINAGTGNVTLAPATTGNTIEICDSGEVACDGTFDTTYDLIGFSSITANRFTIGRSTHTGDITIQQASPGFDLTVENSGAGGILINGNYLGSGSNLVLIAGDGTNSLSGTGISDGTAGAGGNTITVTDLTLTSAGAIDLQTDAATVLVTETGGNAVTLTDSGGGGDTTFDIGTVNAVGATDITQTTNDLLIGSVDATGSTVTLDSLAGAIQGTGNDGTADILGTTVDLTAASGGIGTTTTLEVTATTALNADTTADDGNILIDSIGNLPLGLVDAGAGTVTLDSTADISDADAAAGNDIQAGTANLTAASGIGGAGQPAAIELIASTVDATNSTSGGIFLNSLGGTAVGTGAVDFASVQAQTAGNIELYAETGTTLSDIDAAAGTIDVQVTGAGLTATDVATGSNNAIDLVTLTSGDISAGLVDAGTGTVTVNSAGDIDGAVNNGVADILGGTINLTAAVGGIGVDTVLEVTADTALNADTVTGDDSNILIDSIGHLPLGLVDAGTGDVTLEGTTSMTDTNGAGVVNVRGDLLTLNAGTTDLGTAADPLDTDGNNLDLTAASDLFIVETDAVTIDSATATTGLVDISNSADDMTLGGAVTAGTTVDLDTAGSLVDGNDGSTTVTGTTVTLAAGTDVGAAGNGAIDTAATNLDLTAGSDIYLRESDGVTIDGATATAGLIDLRNVADGNIIVNGGVTAGSSIDLRAEGGLTVNTFTINAGTTLDLTVDSDNDAQATLDLNTGTLTAGTGISLIGDGNDILAAQDLVNTWTVTGANTGTLDNTQITGVVAGYSGIDTILGGADIDTIDQSGEPAIDVTLTAAGTDDGMTGSITGLINFDNIDAMTGTGNGDSLTAFDTTATWTIDGGGTENYLDVASGQDLDFSDEFTTLTGGAGADTFELSADYTADLVGDPANEDGADSFIFTGTASLTGSIDGGVFDGAGGGQAISTDIIDFSGSSLGQIVNIIGVGTDNGQQGTITDDGSVATPPDTDLISAGFDNINQVDGSGGVLAGPNTDIWWNIETTNEGTFGNSLADIGNTAFNNFRIEAGSGMDTFVFQDAGEITGDVDGGGGTNILAGSLGADVFEITGSSSVDITTQNGAGPTTTLTSITRIDGTEATDDGTTTVGDVGADTFTIANNWAGSLNANGGNDRFAFTGGSVGGTLDGGAGTNTLDYSALAGPVSITLTGTSATTGFAGTNALITGGFSNINDLVGSGGTDTLTGRNTNATWAVTGGLAGQYTSGNTLTFADIENLTGRSGVDTFNITGSHAGVLTGGTANDLFDFQAGGLSVTTLAGGSGTDEISGPDTATTFTLTTNGGGNLSAGATAAFNGVENLSGGTAGDTFDVTANHAGALSGNAGNDNFTVDAGVTLTGSPTGNGGDDTFAISGTVNGNTFGDAGDDTFNLIGNGNVTGIIDGGGQPTADTLDISGKTGSVTLTVENDFTDIETLIGSGNDVLVGSNSGASNWDLTAGSGGTINTTTAFNGFNTVRSGTGGDNTFTANGNYNGTVNLTGTRNFWNYSSGNTLTNGTVSGTGSLTIGVPATGAGGDMTVAAGDLDLPNLTSLTGPLFIGGVVDPATTPLDNQNVTVNTDILSVQDTIDTGGDLVLLGGQIDLDASTMNVGGAMNFIATGTTCNACGPINGGNANGNVVVNQPITVNADSGFIAAAGGVTNATSNLTLAFGGGDFQLAVSQAQQESSTPNPVSNATGIELTTSSQNFINNILGLDLISTVVNFFNPALQLFALEDISFIDTGLFQEDLSLFGTIGEGIALELAQCEEIEGCAPNVTMEELEGLIEGLESRIGELEKRIADAPDEATRQELEQLLADYKAELEEFVGYREELQAFLTGPTEGDELGDDLGEDFVPGEQELPEGEAPDQPFTSPEQLGGVDALARMLETIQSRVDFLESLKGDAERRAELGERTGIDLTQEALDTIIENTRKELQFIESLMQDVIENSQSRRNDVFSADAGGPPMSLPSIGYNAEDMGLGRGHLPMDMRWF